jgi:hypothetical protein
MKLIFCPRCFDVRKLQRHQTYCDCGYVSGRYDADGAHATVSPEASVIGIDNHTLRRAIVAPRDKDGGHRTICAWLMGDDASRVRWEEQPAGVGSPVQQLRQKVCEIFEEIEKGIPPARPSGPTEFTNGIRYAINRVELALDEAGYPRP